MIDEKKLIEYLETLTEFERKKSQESAEIGAFDMATCYGHGEYCYKNAINAAEEQPKIGGWIPCSDQLPDKWEDVMICYYNDREEKHLSDIACLDDDGNWKLWRESGGYFPYNFKKKITHWRPLPDLPEECHG